ncbi:MAG: hypothetical protein O3C69_04535 [Chloroflexi bacterium]|nr:hypothetical protein [Chloroflexota bacterium]
MKKCGPACVMMPFSPVTNTSTAYCQGTFALTSHDAPVVFAFQALTVNTPSEDSDTSWVSYLTIDRRWSPIVGVNCGRPAPPESDVTLNSSPADSLSGKSTPPMMSVGNCEPTVGSGVAVGNAVEDVQATSPVITESTGSKAASNR